MKEQYVAVGKEVVLIVTAAWGSSKTTHYADATNELAAQTIAHALNSVYLARVGVPCMTCKSIGQHEPNCVEWGHNDTGRTSEVE